MHDFRVPCPPDGEEAEKPVPSTPAVPLTDNPPATKPHLHDSFRDYLTVKKSQIMAKWTRDDGETTAFRSEQRSAREFMARRRPDPNPSPPRKAVPPADPPSEEVYVKPHPKMPRNPSEWLQKQLQMKPDERLSVPRPAPEREPPAPETTGKRSLTDFYERQSKSEKVRRRNRSPREQKKQVPVDGPVFERLYGRSVKKPDQELSIPPPKPEKKIVWSNDERWTKPRPTEEPMPPEPYPREKLFLKSSRKMAKGKRGIGERAKRDFSDMIEEYRIRAREERLRNEHSEQFQ
jgi:hypothetical protein